MLLKTRQITALLLLLLLPSMAAAQTDVDLESWLDETDNTEAISEWRDTYTSLQHNPLNINDTAAIARIPFLSPFQHRALRNYIMLYGQLLSLNELHFVPGFDSTTVALMSTICTARPIETQQPLRLSDGRHTLVTAVGSNIERAAGYTDGRYAGDPLRALLCYSFSLHDRINLRVVADKDPTEPWTPLNFYSYHLEMKEFGRLEHLILGRFNLQFGQGLTLWTGLQPFGFMGTGTLRFGHGTRPSATFYETDYQNGVALRLRLFRHSKLSAFGSDAFGERMLGGHYEYQNDHLMAGITVAHSQLDSVEPSRTYLYQHNRFQGRQLTVAGGDLMWQRGNLTLFGELSIDHEGHPAAVGGGRLQASENTRIELAGRYFHPDYHNLHTQPYAIGNGQGEQGTVLEATTRLPFDIRAAASLDVHRFSILRYGSYQPSSGTWFRSRVERPIGRTGLLSINYTHRLKERNIPSLDTAVWLGESTARQVVQTEFRFTTGHWQLQARCTGAWFESDNGVRQRGAMASARATYSHKRWTATGGLALFDVDGYYARIYLSESYLQYAWSTPALTGRGLRSHLLLRYRLSTRLTLAARYGLLYLPGEEQIGTGASATEGPLRQSWMVQLRWHS